ncbi:MULTISPECIES: cytochrome c oxidase subunit 3 family protein [unclassified Pseudomonas]|uniref:cytochrome c oxidase subunit 3 family protein n=1 Tax=unclassified Pseudomonas TaxID=196821 RepID=UPI0013049D2A|nr:MULTISPECIES: cytochrome c oxidase subunit 3 family protein [unclassified Pseudomonas]
MKNIENTIASERKIPGDPGVWILIIGDLLVFAILFFFYACDSAKSKELFHISRSELTQSYGVINTFLLLTSSWCIATALKFARQGKRDHCLRFTVATIVCGVGFIVVKLLEYTDKISAGVNILTNDFFMYYFMLTGIHFFHTIIGIGVLVYMWRKIRNDQSSMSGNLLMFETGASYWHMVDLLWIVIFYLLYLMS